MLAEDCPEIFGVYCRIESLGWNSVMVISESTS